MNLRRAVMKPTRSARACRCFRFGPADPRPHHPATPAVQPCRQIQGVGRIWPAAPLKHACLHPPGDYDLLLALDTDLTLAFNKPGSRPCGDRSKRQRASIPPNHRSTLDLLAPHTRTYLPSLIGRMGRMVVWRLWRPLGLSPADRPWFHPEIIWTWSTWGPIWT
jgi:hypothetical protein